MEIYLKETVRDEHKIQKIYTFPNGYGASVIKGPYTQGGNEDKWEICPWVSDTKEYIGDSLLGWGDVIRGWLHDPDVHAILGEISRLPVLEEDKDA